MAHPTGTRPTRDIYDIVAYTPAGKPERVVDRATEAYRRGMGDVDAAARCGIGVDTIREWLRRGAELAADLYSGRRPLATFTRHERKCFDFTQACAVAETEGKMLLIARADQLAQGGVEVVTITEKVNAQGTVIERTTKRERTLPDGPMIRWRLATRWPKEFRDRAQLELTGTDNGPIQLDAGPILERLLGEVNRIATNNEATDALLAGIEHHANGNGHAPAPA